MQHDHHSHNIKFDIPGVDEKKVKKGMRHFLVESMKFLGLFVFFFAIFASVLIFPALKLRAVYWYENIGLSSIGADKAYGEETLPEVRKVETASDNQFGVVHIAGVDKEFFPQESWITIPKIKVDAPIIELDTINNDGILDQLKQGVGHYKGTALPGRVGNMFLTGHSTYYAWSGGKYNQIFALLDKLDIGDEILVYYQGEEYVYKVNGEKVVKPTAIEVLNPTPTPTLTLMTCTPLGTNLNRLIVTADLVSTTAPLTRIAEYAADLGIDNVPAPVTVDSGRLPLF